MEENQLYLQLIIVDRYEYDEHSTRLMEHLRKTLLDKRYKGEYKFDVDFKVCLLCVRFLQELSDVLN